MLSFLLLGQVIIAKNGVPLERFRSQKEAALLIYLAHTQKTHQRDVIASLFWGESSTKQSLTNLRTAIARLRKKVGEALQVTRTTIALNPALYTTADSAQLLKELALNKQLNSAEEVANLTETLECYHGDFLADFFPANAQQFNEWADTTRRLYPSPNHQRLQQSRATCASNG